MIVQLALYLCLSLAMVMAMTVMILKIGAMIGDCPKSGRAARAAAVTIATGYAMIGLGGAGLIAAAIPFINLDGWAVLPCLGLVAICLGLGFTNAVATLRAVVQEAVAPEPAPSAPVAPDPGAATA